MAMACCTRLHAGMASLTRASAQRRQHPSFVLGILHLAAVLPRGPQISPVAAASGGEAPTPLPTSTQPVAAASGGEAPTPLPTST